MPPPSSASSAPVPLAVQPGSLAAWRIAVRPRTLWIATIPVVVATSLAWALAGVFSAWVAAIALAAAILMQVISNLQNDVGYTRRGLETGSRIGLPRATANGWLEPSAVNRAIVAAVVLAQVIALPLMLRGGWPIVLTSVSSTVAAWAYMGGPRPIAYTPWGEATVFVFFGLVAVLGAYYVQVGSLALPVWCAAAALGMHAAAVLLVNNFRDRRHDLATGRRTLAVVAPRRLIVSLYALLLVAPFALVAWLAAQVLGPWFLLPLCALPRAITLARALPTAAPGAAQNVLMFRTVLLEVAFGGLLAAGALLHRMAQPPPFALTG